jgi:hypothetical protein
MQARNGVGQLILYHWAWYDQSLGEIVAGWSQRGEVDEADYIHLEAERLRDPRTMQVDQEGMRQIEPHTLSGLTALPLELRTDDRRPPRSAARGSDVQLYRPRMTPDPVACPQ